MYQLLFGAHYRASPLGLRCMMDAPGQALHCVRTNSAVTGALQLVAEGGLSPEFSRAVWVGFRRPCGNLAAQSLAVHDSSSLAVTLSGLRISRTTAHPACQHEGFGRKMIASVAADATGYDYPSISFSYTPELWRFW